MVPDHAPDEFAGADGAFLAPATAHHARCQADAELNHPFSHGDLNPEHVQRLADYWAEVLGGGCGRPEGPADAALVVGRPVLIFAGVRRRPGCPS